MRGQALAVASAVFAAALTMAPAAQAQNYSNGYNNYHDEHVDQQRACAQRRNGNTAAGAVVGGIAGAVLGSQAAARGHRSDGSVLGAVVGAAAGAAIARSNSRCQSRPQGAYDPYYGQPYGQDPYARQSRDYGDYRDDDSDLYGGPGARRTSYGRRDEGNCRWGEQILRDPEGYEYRENVYMCRGRDGVWRAQD